MPGRQLSPLVLLSYNVHVPASARSQALGTRYEAMMLKSWLRLNGHPQLKGLSTGISMPLDKQQRTKRGEQPLFRSLRSRRDLPDRPKISSAREAPSEFRS